MNYFSIHYITVFLQIYKILRRSADTQTVLGGLTTHPLVANFL